MQTRSADSVDNLKDNTLGESISQLTDENSAPSLIEGDSQYTPVSIKKKKSIKSNKNQNILNNSNDSNPLSPSTGTATEIEHNSSTGMAIGGNGVKNRNKNNNLQSNKSYFDPIALCGDCGASQRSSTNQHCRSSCSCVGSTADDSNGESGLSEMAPSSQFSEFSRSSTSSEGPQTTSRQSRGEGETLAVVDGSSSSDSDIDNIFSASLPRKVRKQAGAAKKKGLTGQVKSPKSGLTGRVIVTVASTNSSQSENNFVPATSAGLPVRVSTRVNKGNLMAAAIRVSEPPDGNDDDEEESVCMTCPICKRSYSNKQNITTHVNSIHRPRGERGGA